MSIKRDLQDHYWIKKSIEHLEEQLFVAETRAMSTSQELSDEPRGSSVDKDKLCACVAAIIDYKDTINEKLKEAYELKDKIERAIVLLPMREQQLIRLRYIETKSIDEVAAIMSYSRKQINRVFKKAVAILDSEKDVPQCPIES